MKYSRKRDSNDARGITVERVLFQDIVEYMASVGIDRDSVELTVPEKSEVNVTIARSSSTGDGIGRIDEQSTQVFVIPFAIPGDVVKARVYRNNTRPFNHSVADFLGVVKPSPDRDDNLIRCKYFGNCGGCQYQMLPYEKQLAQKRRVVEKAFRNFSHLPPELIPTVQETHPSPLQYGFRTKLTPHFDAPPGPRRKETHFDSVPPIGFINRNTSRTMDIEECPIGSDILQHGLRIERQNVADRLQKYTKGATILLRETAASRTPINETSETRDLPQWDEDTKILLEQKGNHLYHKKYITSTGDTSTDYIDDYKLTAPANSFFQNNNSILPSFIDYIRSLVSGPPSPTTPPTDAPITDPTSATSPNPPPTPRRKPHHKNLIDAYCGTGLFSLTLAPLFTRTIGIDIDKRSIACAEANVRPNARLLPPLQRFPSSSATLHRSPDVLAEEDGGGDAGEGAVGGAAAPAAPAAAVAGEAAHDDMRMHPPSPNPNPNPSTPQDKDKAPENKAYTNIHSQSISFIAASAEHLFASVKDFSPSETVVILDPPRKGCDVGFLRQLREFAPEKVVYVSCNVHTLARDVGWLMGAGGEGGGVEGGEGWKGGKVGEHEGEEDVGGGMKEGTTLETRLYDLESLKGFDFFPQTAHVEGVAVLNRRR